MTPLWRRGGVAVGGAGAAATESAAHRVLLAGTPTSFSLRAKAFLDGLRDVGYVEGKTVAIEWKWAQDRVERLPELAASW